LNSNSIFSRYKIWTCCRAFEGRGGSNYCLKLSLERLILGEERGIINVIR